MSRATLLTGLMMAAAALTVADSAAAQELGTRLGPRGTPAVIAKGGMTTSDTARLAIVDFATCVLQRERARAMTTLAAFPDRAGYEGLRKLGRNGCLSQGTLEFDLTLFRGALFTALYRERFGAKLPVLPEASANFREGAPDPLDDISGQAIALREFGECVVRRDPGVVHSIVTAKIGSAEEDALYKALVPHLGPCLNAGLQVKFSKTVLSGLLAEVLYRDAASGSTTPSAGKD